MTEETADYLTDIADRDQQDAELADISRAVARHYTLMVGAGMCELSAVTLCKGFQHDLMGGDNVMLGMIGGDE